MVKKSKLRIAHIHWGFPPIIGGVETHLVILLPALVKMGHQVSLLTGSFEGVKGEYKYRGVHIFRHPVMDLNWLCKRGVNGLGEEIRGVFGRYLDKTKPDCLHVHNMHYFSKPHARTLQEIADKKGIPLILTAHNVWDDNLFLDLTKKIKWTHIIAVSHFIKKEIIGIGYDYRKVTVIHHGVEHEIYACKRDKRRILRKYPILRGKRIIFHPARMGLAKGCDVSIKSLKIVRNKITDAVLVLAGTKNIIDWGLSQQKDIAYMVTLAKVLGLEQHIVIDMFKLDDMPHLYSACDVCVYPSTSPEPFGLTMLEALAAGKPMIVTKTGGMPEVIKDGINGFVIPVKDFESLASRTIQLLEDHNLRQRLGHNGRAMVREQYSSKIVTENTLKVYRRFC